MANFLRLSIFGTLPTGEEWSVNPAYNISDFGVSTTPAQVQAVATAAAAVSPGASMLALWTTTTALTGVRVEARDNDGTLENLAEAIRAIPLAGSGTSAHPFQTATVTSLRTAQVGQSGRGRLYWPATGCGIANATLRLSAPTPTALLTAVSTYLGAIQTAVRVTFAGANLAVWSRKMNLANNVTSLQQGDVLDTQRRRRDTLVENYVSVAYP
jgi:hypothetical protein